MLAIIISSLRRKLTNGSVLLNLVVMPLLLIVILGNALASTFNHDSTSTGPTGASALGVVDLDRSAASRELVSALSGSGAFKVTPFDASEAGRQALADSSVAVVATIPAGYATAQQSGHPAQVELSAVDANIDHLRASQIAIDAVSDATRAGAALASVTAPGTPTAPYAARNYIAAGTSTAADPAAGVSGITYYTVTMLVLILLYGLGNTMNFVKEEYDGPLGDRYLASPTSKFSLVAAQVISGTVTSIIQASVIVAAARFFFHANIGATPWVAAVIIVIAATLFNSVGLLFGLLGRTRPWLDPLMSLLIPAMTFLGGGFVKLDFGGIEKLSVNNLFQAALFREIAGFATQWGPLYVCAGVTGVVLALSAVMVKEAKVR